MSHRLVTSQCCECSSPVSKEVFLKFLAKYHCRCLSHFGYTQELNFTESQSIIIDNNYYQNFGECFQIENFNLKLLTKKPFLVQCFHFSAINKRLVGVPHTLFINKVFTALL